MTSATLPGLDLGRLTEFLGDRLPGGLAGPLRATLIAGGRSNLTYRLEDGRSRWILRRPPLGHVLPTAHDMSREATVMHALGPTEIPVPQVLVTCEDVDVIGAGFYLMEHVDGVVHRTDADLAALTDRQAKALSRSLVDVLAALHTTDHVAVGLAGFGRPDGYVDRQVRRWGVQYESSKSREVSGFDRLAEMVGGERPRPQPAAIVHGDYRQDNVITAVDDPGRILAVLDWEMATIGDPLTDLGMLAVYWAGWAGLNNCNPITGVPGDHPSFPGVAELVAQYGERTGFDLTDLDWYIGFAFYKLAVILEGIHFRYVQKQTVGEGFEGIGAMVPELVTRGIATLERRHGLQP